MSMPAERRISGQVKEESTAAPTKTLPQIAERLSDLGALVSRYGLVLVIFWIGAMKFTSYEANGIQPLVANSPFMGWLYRFLSVEGFSDLLGVVEIAIAVMIGLQWLSASVGYRERAGDTDVSNDAELSIFDTRLGAQLGRIPGFSSGSGTVLVKRYRVIRRVHLVIWESRWHP